jgi:DNA-binding LacI/PurR family transcriptional regulator
MSSMVARLRDVAEAAGVSIRTVSNVVNDFPHVKPEVRRRVQEAIDELGYRPNLAARQLRRGRTGMIALAVPDLQVPYFGELAAHVLREAERRGLTLLIEQTDGEKRRETVLMQGPRSQFIDGLILSPLAATPDELPTGPAALPLVLLGERISDPRFDHVAIDNVAAARTATAHLIGSGRRRIAALGAAPGSGSTMADLRLRGYDAAMAEGGLPVDPALVVETTWFTRQDGYEATRRLIRAGVELDSLFCFTDLLALGAIRALLEHGLKVPGDVAVVGIDGSEEGQYATPSLTSISPNKEEIAGQALALLVTRIDGAEPHDGVDCVPSFTLVVRESAP